MKARHRVVAEIAVRIDQSGSAVLFGVLAAIFSSVCVAAPILIYFGLRSDQMSKKEDVEAAGKA